jgi:hypothetical protein
MDASFFLTVNSFITRDFLLRTFPLSSSKINLCSKRCLGVIGWVPTSLIDSRHDEVCVHKKIKKMSNIRRQVSRQQQKIFKNGNITLSAMMLGTPRSNNDDERSFFQWVDSFRMEMPQLQAIFRSFQKTLHKFFKNRTLDIGLPPPKCTKYKVYRHEKK